MIRVLLADGSEQIVANLSRSLAGVTDLLVCGTAGDGDHAIQEALQLRPDVAVIDASLPGMDGIQVTEMLAQFVPDAGVIITSLEGETDLIRRAMLAGAREVLRKPFRGDDLVSAIHGVYAFQERKRANIPAPATALEATAGGGRAAAPVSPRVGSGRLFSVLAGKGGVGKTIIATNLALALARGAEGQRVALLDLSLQFGDVAALLDIHSPRTIADLAANDAIADREVVQQVLAQGPSGIDVLPAPSSPELADYVTTHHLRALLDELRVSHHLLVADTTSQLNEITLEAVESSDRVILVTDYSVTGVKNTRLLLTVLEVLHLPSERIVVVANARDPKTENHLDRAQAEGFLHTPIALEIPHDPAVVGASVSRGVPFLSSAPQSLAGRAIVQLADLLIGPARAAPAPATPPEPKRQRRRLGFAR